MDRQISRQFAMWQAGILNVTKWPRMPPPPPSSALLLSKLSATLEEVGEFMCFVTLGGNSWLQTLNSLATSWCCLSVMLMQPISASVPTLLSPLSPTCSWTFIKTIKKYPVIAPVLTIREFNRTRDVVKLPLRRAWSSIYRFGTLTQKSTETRQS
jgi:hypothetical protein